MIAFGILALERRGYRRFEPAIIALLGLVAAGFIYVFFAAGGQDYGGIANGLIPRLEGSSTSPGRGIAVWARFLPQPLGRQVRTISVSALVPSSNLANTWTLSLPGRAPGGERTRPVTLVAEPPGDLQVERDDRAAAAGDRRDPRVGSRPYRP
ncbi:MAG TPA: hypothetical protein VHB53_03655 [Solirubrobacterales bacterium]|nr:hypothetical protein [Solirubrobacterales bacterium]